MMNALEILPCSTIVAPIWCCADGEPPCVCSMSTAQHNECIASVFLSMFFTWFFVLKLSFFYILDVCFVACVYKRACVSVIAISWPQGTERFFVFFRGRVCRSSIRDDEHRRFNVHDIARKCSVSRATSHHNDLPA